MSLWLVEKNQRVIATGRMAVVRWPKQAVDCSPIYRGLSPLLTKPWGVTTSDCKPEEVGYPPAGAFPPRPGGGGDR